MTQTREDLIALCKRALVRSDVGFDIIDLKKLATWALPRLEAEVVGDVDGDVSSAIATQYCNEVRKLSGFPKVSADLLSNMYGCLQGVALEHIERHIKSRAVRTPGAIETCEHCGSTWDGEWQGYCLYSAPGNFRKNCPIRATKGVES